MQDTLTGTVKHILDGESFVLQATVKPAGNQYKYADEETVVIRGMLARPYGDAEFENDKQLLRNYVENKVITCYIYNRDERARLVCRIEVT